MNQELNKLSTQVAKTLKLVDDKVIKNNKLDWEQIKRTPQILKRKINLSDNSFTIDEEFNSLQYKFKIQEDSIKKLIYNLKEMNNSMLDVLKNSIVIADNYRNLIDPYCDFHKTFKTFIERDLIWNKISNYKTAVQKIDFSKEINEFVHYNVKKLEIVLDSFKIIYKKIQKRNNELIDFDKFCNNYESLLFKQKNNELTIKQNNNLFSIKRKMDDCKNKYDLVNKKLKLQLPQFFKLVQQLIDFIQIDVYYLNLRYMYMILTNLKDHITNENFEEFINMLEEKNANFFKEIEQFGIIDYEKFEPINMNEITSV
ncbi:uncharacterized protein KGF55_004466 [Candida pseudojiufengensis]|uniref:uncharacterized protein n=1 Tax=Candida pseudojiufengensis TaxID=497109 RepID=UPI00222470FA|nr:uncharacterized protein KGF55_004466 [Candida pseudojiufengensis]KAI5960573.1 hypothetical protein KGF55_004466 [Candida pseudojiufengensis]